MANQSIKSSNSKKIDSYIIAVFLLLVLIGGFDYSTFNNRSEMKYLLNYFSIGASFSIFSYITNLMIPRKIKNLLCWIKTLPGEIIFTHLLQKEDIRFSVNELEENYKSIYNELKTIKDKDKNKKFQNQEWYHIYIKHENSVRVYQSNSDYLLCRDVASMTLIMFIIYVFFIIVDIATFNWTSLITFAILYILSVLATRTQVYAFATNVINQDLSELRKANSSK